MPGSIQKRGENTYYLTVSGGIGLNGKRIRKTKTIKVDGKTEEARYKKAEKELALFIAEVEGSTIDSENLTFEGLSQYWLENHAEPNLEPKTVHEYKNLLRLRINPAIGHIRIAKLKPTHFIELYANLTEEGIRLDVKYKPQEKIKEIVFKYKVVDLCKKTGLSEKTITRLRKLENVNSDSANKLAAAFDYKITDLFEEVAKPELIKNSIEHYRRLINSILNTAVAWGKLSANPAKGIKIPKFKRQSGSAQIEVDKTEEVEVNNNIEEDEATKIKSFNFEQTQTLIELLETAPIKYQAIILLTLFTGVREGEIMGMDLTDLDVENGFARVRKPSQYIPGKGTFQKDTTKTEASKRTIAFAPEIVPVLKKYLSWRKEQKLKCGDKWINSNRLFVREDGSPMHTYTPYKWFKKFLEANGLPKLTFHGLRHTHPTVLLEMGFNDLKEISSRLGHTDIRTTMNIYVDKIKSIDRQAANMFGAKLMKKDNEKISEVK